MPLPPSLDHHWLPFTANRAFQANPRLLVGAEGVHFVDAAGRRLFDAVSGLFCTPAGHSRPEIAEAVGRQLRTLDFAPPCGRGGRPVPAPGRAGWLSGR